MHGLVAFVKQSFWELVRFGISGVSAVVVGIVTLYVFTDVLSLWYVPSSVLSFIVVFIYVFLMQKFWTFRERSVSRLPRQTVQNIILSVVNLVLNTILIFVLVEIAEWHYLLAQISIYAFIGAMDFFVYKYWIFRPAD